MENLKTLHDYFLTGETKQYELRIQKLKQLRQSIKNHQLQLQEALNLDLNKPEMESYASEISIVYDEINFAIKHLKSWMKPINVATPLPFFLSKSFICKVPLGVVLVISPWNYPVQLSLSPLVGAIVAGNCVVLKPSEFTPNVNSIIKNILNDVFSKNYVEIYEGDGAKIIPQLINSGIFKHVFFTGSTLVGKEIAIMCATKLIPYTLELGGKSPAIVDNTAKLELVAKRLVWAKFYNAGQTCVAPDYVLVHKEIKEKFIEYCKKYIDIFYNGQSHTMSKIITQKRFNTLCDYLEGTDIIYGGGYNRETLSFEPTLLNEPSLSHKVMQEEIFGPILPLLTYENFTDIVEVINHNPNPLALYVFSEDKQFTNNIIQNIQFGGGGVNIALMHVVNINLPFGGIMSSGCGKYHGKYSFDIFSHSKSILNMSTKIDVALKYPPYTKFKTWLLRKLLPKPCNTK